MKLTSLYASGYIENLCSGFEDGREETENTLLLEDIKTLSPSEFKDLKDFSDKIYAFRSIYNDEIPVEKTAKEVENYEAAIDDAALSDKNKIKLYGDLLTYYERERAFSPHYFAVLDKNIALIPDKDDGQLVQASWRAIHAHRGVSRGLYLRTLQRAYNKFKNKTMFPRRDMLGLTMAKSKRGKFSMVPPAKLTKDQAKERFDVIQDIFKTPLSSDEKIALAEEVIELATKTPFARSKNFEIKRDMNLLIVKELEKSGRENDAGKYRREASRWQRNIELAMDKGYERSGRDFDYK
ncbi:MAG: hypothetical protein J6Y91_02570 [Alphaproteobacteria bacterium]|nr:hypothetical protein [Alphaproteobacteria bacterium]